MPIYEEYLYVVSTDSSAITSLNELKDKRVSTGAPDSVTEDQARFVFHGLGIDWDHDITRERLTVTESIELIPIAEEDAEDIMRANSGVFHNGTIPAAS